MDGETKLWDKQGEMFPEAVGVLDIFHVMEHLWPCVHRFEKENTPKAFRLFEKQFRRILEGRVGRVIGAFRQMAVKRKLKRGVLEKLEEHLTYFENNRDRMKYDEYLEQGFPIGSGVVEGACRNLVKDRMERTGMRWGTSGAQAILDLRAVYLNGDWSTFHKYLIRREQKQLYPNRSRLIKSFQSPQLGKRNVDCNHFIWHLSPEDGDVPALSRERFFVQGDQLYREFEDVSGRFGAYLSKDAFGGRLKLDVKPIIVPREEEHEERIQFAFNFHRDVDSEDNPA